MGDPPGRGEPAPSDGGGHQGPKPWDGRAPRVGVVGGGIAGLSAALAVVEAGAHCHLFEAGPRLGGKLQTGTTPLGAGTLVVEAGADSILSAKPAGLDLIRRLGLTERVIDTRPERPSTFVYSRGRLRALPEGFVLGSPARAGGLLRSGLVSLGGALRMAAEVGVAPRRDGAEETVAAFFTRRLGREAFERVVEPLLAGIHAGDATRLSLAATFPRFVAMERDHGGLLRAAIAGRRGRPGEAGHTPFVSLAGGLGELIEALRSRLGGASCELAVGAPVEALASRPGGGWRLSVAGRGEPLDVDAVVLATPARVTARLLRPHDPEAASFVDSICHTSTATVSLAYRRSGDAEPPRGFGFVVPRVEGRPLIAGTWTTNKWPGRAPDDMILARGYLGGAGREPTLEGDDEELVGIVRAEFGRLAGVVGVPVHAEVHRFPDGMPQYTLGHTSRVEELRARLRARPGLAVAGAAYGGVGIPDCIADATAAAAEVMAGLPEGIV